MNSNINVTTSEVFDYFFEAPLKIKKISDSDFKKISETQKTKSNNIYYFFRFFYLKNIKHRFIRLKSLSKFFRRKMTQIPKNYFEIPRRKEEELNELDLTMRIIKKNVNLYFEANNYEEKKEIFNSFFESVQKHD